METKHLTRPFSTAAVSAEGTFSGYGSVFGVEDSYEDIVMPGAFTRSLAEHAADGTKPLMLWQHNPDQPIGIYTKMAEDEKGLFVEGKLALGTQAGKEAHELLKMGALSGLSIGFSTRKYEVDKETGIRRLLDVKLWEVSPVSFPANDRARIDSVKGLLESPRFFERQLRDALGLSREQAKRLMAGGWSALLRDAGGAEEEESDARDATSGDGMRPLRDAGDGNREVLARLKRLASVVQP